MSQAGLTAMLTSASNLREMKRDPEAALFAVENEMTRLDAIARNPIIRLEPLPVTMGLRRTHVAVVEGLDLGMPCDSAGDCHGMRPSMRGPKVFEVVSARDRIVGHINSEIRRLAYKRSVLVEYMATR